MSRSRIEGRSSPEERRQRAALVELMWEIFDASDGNDGVPRMDGELRHAEVKINNTRRAG